DGLSLPAAGEGGDDLGQGLSRPSRRGLGVSDTPQLLLAHHLKALKLPTFLREYDKLAQQCAAEGVDHPRYLLRLAELELIERERRMVERRIKGGTVPDGQKPRQFRLHGDPVAQQDVGPGTRPLRVHCSPRERHRGRQQRHWEDAHCSRIGAGGLPEGLVGRLHYRGRPGPRADRGPGREATAPPPAPTGGPYAAVVPQAARPGGALSPPKQYEPSSNPGANHLKPIGTFDGHRHPRARDCWTCQWQSYIC